jgi:hypothetical protein
MRRRDFVKSLAVSSGLGALGLPMSRIYAAPNLYEYDGNLLITLQMDGGWDVTSLCDPKTNQPGEPQINHWATDGEIREAGNIAYAPFANNASLFDKYYRDMLIINGVDAQTNSHTVGVLHNWSGKTAEGLPTLSALFAAHNSPDMPLSYLNFGGYAQTSGLIRYSRLDDIDSLIDLLDPNAIPWDRNRSWRSNAEVSRVQTYQQAAMERRLTSPTLTPRQRENINAYLGARSSREALHLLLDILPDPDDFQPDRDLGELGSSSLLRQIQLTLLTFKAGIGSASDLWLGGFDTHANHDALHLSLFEHVVESVDYLWTFANELGIAERITLVIGSDFGRTPFYNADTGKDHWPIGSYIVMAKDAPWGNRVVGSTDELHNAHSINPSSLQVDNQSGTIIYPKHVHQALRRHLGIEAFGMDHGLGFPGTEDFDFFNPGKQT